jgi:hypothetical protein
MTETLNIKVKDLIDHETLKKVYGITKKTKFPSNKPLTHLPVIQSTVAKYIAQKPFLSDIPVTIKTNFPNAYYDTRKKVLTVGLFNAYIIAHELEHAISVKESETFKNLLMSSRILTNYTGSYAIPIYKKITESHGDISNEQKKKWSNILNLAEKSHLHHSVPGLFEEGKANFNAIMTAENKDEAMKSLLPAYTSYLKTVLGPANVYAKSRGNLE